MEKTHPCAVHGLCHCDARAGGCISLVKMLLTNFCIHEVRQLQLEQLRTPTSNSSRSPTS
jgi:predicted DNA-binding helix-hairpin-helix protein